MFDLWNIIWISAINKIINWARKVCASCSIYHFLCSVFFGRLMPCELVILIFAQPFCAETINYIPNGKLSALCSEMYMKTHAKSNACDDVIIIVTFKKKSLACREEERGREIVKLPTSINVNKLDPVNGYRSESLNIKSLNTWVTKHIIWPLASWTTLKHNRMKIYVSFIRSTCWGGCYAKLTLTLFSPPIWAQTVCYNFHHVICQKKISHAKKLIVF